MSDQCIDLTADSSDSQDARAPAPAPSIDLTASPTNTRAPDAAESIRCVATGLLLATTAEAQQYAAETGLTSFAESTEEASGAAPDTSRDAALAERLAHKESARAKPSGAAAPDTSRDAELAASLTSRDPTASDAALAKRLAARDAQTEGDAELAAQLASNGAVDTSGDAALAARLVGEDDAKRRRVEPVAALAKIRQMLTEPADLARPDEAVKLYPQPDGWSCGYRCLQTIVFALRRAGAEYGAALVPAGLAEPGKVASVYAIQTAVQRAWECGFDAEGARQTRDRLRGRFPFVGSREWIGCCEACVVLRCAGVRADVKGFDGRRDALGAEKLVECVSNYFQNVVGVGSDDVWGAACLPPAMVCFGGHNRCVVGVSRDRLIMLDPKWHEPRLQFMAAADLRHHARQWECLVVRPGIATRPLPTDPGAGA